MIMRPLLRTAIVGLVGWAPFGMASALAAGAPSQCQRIQDPQQRLRCYDGLSAGGEDLLSSIVLSELACKRRPHAAGAMASLVRAGITTAKPFRVADSLNFFSLRRPMKVDGLNVIAVFGFDEEGNFPFVRGPGTSPGFVFGILTKDDLAAVGAWRDKHNKDLELGDSYSGITGAKELSCTKFAGQD